MISNEVLTKLWRGAEGEVGDIGLFDVRQHGFVLGAVALPHSG